LGAFVAQLFQARSDGRRVVSGTGSGALAAQLLHACADPRKIVSSAGSVHVSSVFFAPRNGGNKNLGDREKPHFPKPGQRLAGRRAATEIAVPRDRQGSFEPQIVAKGLEGFDERIISLYARGLSVREIQAHLPELYGVEVCPDLISRVTDDVGIERHAFRNAAEGDPGYFGLALTQRNVIAINGACFLTRRDVFERLRGFNEYHRVVNNETDYCLRAWRELLLLVFTPYSKNHPPRASEPE
jgi:hypothetical protein